VSDNTYLHLFISSSKAHKTKNSILTENMADGTVKNVKTPLQNNVNHSTDLEVYRIELRYTATVLWLLVQDRSVTAMILWTIMVLKLGSPSRIKITQVTSRALPKVGKVTA